MSNNIELARAWLDHFPEGEFDKFPGKVSPDLTLRLPFTPPGVPNAIHGRERVREALAQSGQGRSRLIFSDIELWQTDDPELVVGTANAQATMKNGNIYKNSYAIFIRIRDGVVLDHTEYLNPLAIIESMNGPTEVR